MSQSKKRRVILPLLLSLFLAGCSATTNDDDLSDRLIATATCTRQFEIVAELAIPGEIYGFDCYDENSTVELVYRSSTEYDTLLMSQQTWYSTPEAPLYVTWGPDWFILVDEKNRRAIEEETSDQSFEDIGIPDDEGEDPYGHDPQTCAQFAAALSYSYAYEGVGLPDNMSAEAQDLFESSFSGLIKTGTLTTYPENAVEILIVLGNYSRRINQFCADGGDIFNGF